MQTMSNQNRASPIQYIFYTIDHQSKRMYLLFTAILSSTDTFIVQVIVSNELDRHFSESRLNQSIIRLLVTLLPLGLRKKAFFFKVMLRKKSNSRDQRRLKIFICGRSTNWMLKLDIFKCQTYVFFVCLF